MAKQSGYLQKLAMQQAIRDEKTRRFTLQQCKDMMLITMHEDFGWGEERLKKLSDCYDQTFMTYAEMCLHAGQGGRAPEEGLWKILCAVG